MFSNQNGFIPIVIAVVVTLALGTGLFVLNKTMPGGLGAFKVNSNSQTSTPKEGFGQQLSLKTTTVQNQNRTNNQTTVNPPPPAPAQQIGQTITYTQPFPQTQIQNPAPAANTTQDTTPPTITFTGGPSGTISSSGFCFTFAPFTDNISSTQDITGSYKLDDSDWTNWQPSINLAAVCFTNMGNGQHAFRIRLKDKAGNIKEESRSFTVNVQTPADTTPPTIILSPLPSQAITTSDPCFYFSATDNITPPANISFSYKLDNSNWLDWQKIDNAFAFCFKNIPDGQHTASLRIKDASGNISEQSLNFTVAAIKPPPSSANDFREQIFTSYGFTSSAADYIRQNSIIEVKNLNSDCGGGGWAPWSNTVIMECAQHEGTVHELSHVFWHKKRIQYPQTKKDLVRDVVKLADMDPFGSSEYKDVVAFAKNYVYGNSGWTGMYCNNNQCASDVHNLTDADFGPDSGDGSQSKVNDWEIYAGFSSYTMGKFKDGPRKLPQFMWKYFEAEFTGSPSVTPYYEGGHK